MVNLKQSNLIGNTLLHHAVLFKDKKFILNLLLNKIDPHIPNKQNQTVFDLAPEMAAFINDILKVLNRIFSN